MESSDNGADVPTLTARAAAGAAVPPTFESLAEAVARFERSGVAEA